MNVESNLLRAQEAISRARTLSQQLSMLTLRAAAQQGAPDAGGAASPSSSDHSSPSPEQPRTRNAPPDGNEESQGQAAEHVEPGAVPGERAAGRASTTSGTDEDGDGDASDDGAANVGGGSAGDEYNEYDDATTPVLLVAQKLALLQQRQNNTLKQMVLLRLEQMKLREQQLVALQELLRAEGNAIEGTALQVSAVDQAVELLGQSVIDMRAAHRVVLYSTPEDAKAVAAAVLSTDARADEVSRMARQLLSVLREFPRRALARSQGASEEAIADVPTILCHVASPLLGQTCPICLAGFEAGDTLKSITCLHYHHEDCLDQWLRVKACCPACREAMPS